MLQIKSGLSVNPYSAQVINVYQEVNLSKIVSNNSIINFVVWMCLRP